MAKCIVCGKKGLFFKVNAAGRCADCQAKREEQLRIEAEERKRSAEEAERQAEQDALNQYNVIVAGYNRITADFDASDDDEENLPLIPAMEEIVSFCDEFKEQLKSIRENPRIRKIIIDRERANSNYSYAYSNLDTHITYWIHGNEDHVLAFIESATRNTDRQKEGWERSIKLVKASASLAKIQKATPTAEIKKEKTDLPNLNVTDLTITGSNITRRSNYDKLGAFCVIDTETTGLNAGNDKIIEICAVRYREWKPVEKFTTLINPGKHIPITASNINGITDDMVTDSPSVSEIAQGFLAFIGKDNLVGHNIGFDLKFIYKAGIDFTQVKRRYYDTLQLVNGVLKKHKDVPDFKLDTLCNYYYIRFPGSGHRAESDCFATGELFRKIAFQIT